MSWMNSVRFFGACLLPPSALGSLRAATLACAGGGGVYTCYNLCSGVLRRSALTNPHTAVCKPCVPLR
jgi:hypothetical protein